MGAKANLYLCNLFFFLVKKEGGEEKAVRKPIYGSTGLPNYKREGQESAVVIVGGFHGCDAPLLAPPHPSGRWEFLVN